jgi:hypothetical protein
LTTITLVGENFKSAANRVFRVIVGDVNCSEVTVLNDTFILATLPSSDKFTSVVALGLFSADMTVVLIDDIGRSAVIQNGFRFEANYRGDIISAYFEKVGISRYVVSVVALALVIGVSIFTIRQIVLRIKKCRGAQESKRELHAEVDPGTRSQPLTSTPLKGVLDPESDDESTAIEEVRLANSSPYK